MRLYEALGYEPPIFVHTPVVLGPDGGKLSKRHGAKFVLEYADEGYLPDALLNFLATTGWALDDHTEIISRDRLIESFDIMDLSVSPGLFDTQKLGWMNGVYLREMPQERLVDLFVERLERDLPAEVARPVDRALVTRIAPLVQERVKLLAELAPLVDFFFLPEVTPAPPEEFLAKRFRDDAASAQRMLAAAAEAVAALEGWTTAALEARLRALAEELDEKAGDLFMLCRVAVTGRRVTPPLFETMEIVGAERCLERMRAAEEALRATAPSA